MLRLFAIAITLSGCLSDLGSDSNDLTSSDGAEFVIDFDGYVEVPAGASDAVAKDAIHRELKSALGALREQGIGVADRDAQRNLQQPLARQQLQIVNGALVDRVRFHYHDQALVEKSRIPTTNMIDLTLLYGDFVARAGELIPICSDDQTTDGDSLWYHYQPNISSCRNAINAERTAIDQARVGLDANTQISQREANRRFLTTRATLVRKADAHDTYPEYDQLWGFAGNTSRTKLVVYSFFGVDSNQDNARDSGIVEYMRYEREIRRRMPALRVTETNQRVAPRFLHRRPEAAEHLVG